MHTARTATTLPHPYDCAHPVTFSPRRAGRWLAWAAQWLGRWAHRSPAPTGLDASSLTPHLERDLNLRGIPDGWLEGQRAAAQYERHRAQLGARSLL